MTNTIDIIDLIDKNPITKLSSECQNRLICKIKQDFTENQQNLFIASFYCYLNYDQTKDFVIDLRNVWNWLGFSRIEECKRLLVKHFIEETDYKISLYTGNEANKAPQIGGALNNEVKNKIRGCAGLNKEKILLTVKTFKKLCIKSNTKKADEVHEYFVKLEDIIFQTLNEESNELRTQLVKNNKETGLKIRQKEEAIIAQFPENEMCIYIADVGMIDNEHLVKFGESNNLKQRISSHRRTFENFELLGAFKVVNSKKFENKLKEIVSIKYRIRVKEFSGKKCQELIAIDEQFTTQDLFKIIKNLIEKYSNIETYLADIELLKIQEHTKQLEILENTKQIETQEKTKQLQLELEILKLKSSSSLISDPRQSEPRQPVRRAEQPQESVELVKKFMNIKTEFSTKRADYILVEDLYNLFETWAQENNSGFPISIGKATFSRCLSSTQDYIIIRVATGPRVENFKPRKVAIVNRKLI